MKVMIWLRYIRSAVAAHTGPSPHRRIHSVDYDAYWQERGLREPVAPSPDDPWDYPRFVAIASLMDPQERVLDIGCGDGSLLAFLQEQGFEHVVGVEISEVVVEWLSQVRLLSDPLVLGGSRSREPWAR